MSSYDSVQGVILQDFVRCIRSNVNWGIVSSKTGKNADSTLPPDRAGISRDLLLDSRLSPFHIRAAEAAETAECTRKVHAAS